MSDLDAFLRPGDELLSIIERTRRLKIRAYRARPEVKERISQHMRAFWSDPQNYQKLYEAIEVGKAAPEAQRRYKNGIEKRNRDPLMRQKIREAMLRPEVRAKQSRSILARNELLGRSKKIIIRPRIIRLVLDHNHQTGDLRAVLCSGCNLRGKQHDDIDWVRKKLEYLIRHKDHPSGINYNGLTPSQKTYWRERLCGIQNHCCDICGMSGT